MSRRIRYHPCVTEPIADPQVVCPFVALDDDRDHRAPVPDHHHRCFAESPAAPRALAHQAAYCLSGSFPTCPTFVDWARREAAPAKVESPVRSLRDAGPTRSGAVPPAGRSTSRAGGSGGDWTAPPPWGSAAGPAAGAAAGAGGAGAGAAAGGGAGAGAGAAGFEARAPSGPDEIDEAEAAEADDAGFEPSQVARFADPGVAGQPPNDTPAFLAGRMARPIAAPARDDDDEPWSAADDAEPDPHGEPGRVPVAAPRRMPVGYAPVAPGRSERSAGGSRRGRADVSAPSWEQPRRLEEYPTLKSRGGAGIPRAAIYALVILLVGGGLFAAPFLLKGLGGGGDQASPTPGSSASVVPSEEPSPTAVPTPGQVTHTVKSGDTLSTIAKIYGVTVDQILEANPKITNANKIAVGDKIIIPQPLQSEIVDSEITPAP